MRYSPLDYEQRAALLSRIKGDKNVDHIAEIVAELMLARPNMSSKELFAVFMNCYPEHRGPEITEANLWRRAKYLEEQRYL